MTVRYTRAQGQLMPQYVCQLRGIETAQAVCQFIPGAGIDQAVGRLLLETLTPVQIDVTLAVQHEVQSRLAEADALRWQQVERARYEADLAQRYFLRVDPDHRLVAATLEATYNDKLRALQEAQQAYAIANAMVSGSMSRPSRPSAPWPATFPGCGRTLGPRIATASG